MNPLAHDGVKNEWTHLNLRIAGGSLELGTVLESSLDLVNQLG